jgi:hypothetical protein
MNIHKELEDLIEECEIVTYETGSCGYEVGLEINDVRRILKLAYNLGLETAANNAETDFEAVNDDLKVIIQSFKIGEDYEVPVIRHSILKLKI